MQKDRIKLFRQEILGMEFCKYCRYELTVPSEIAQKFHSECYESIENETFKDKTPEYILEFLHTLFELNKQKKWHFYWKIGRVFSTNGIYYSKEGNVVALNFANTSGYTEDSSIPNYQDDFRIIKIPDSITQFKSLRYLDLTGHNLPYIPDTLSYLTNLEFLNISGMNNRSNIDTNSMVKLTSLHNLQELIICDLGLADFPEALTTFKKLKTLYLVYNKLTELPTNFENLTNLERLHLSANKFTVFPEVITKVPNLRSIFIINNQLRSVPDSIKQLVNLKRLALYSNNFKEFPESIFQLQSLGSLTLHNNKISNVPEGIKHLKNLEYLNLRTNNFSDGFPLALANLINATRIELDFKNLTQAGVLKSLEKLTDEQKLNLLRKNLTIIPGMVKYFVKELLEYQEQKQKHSGIEKIFCKYCRGTLQMKFEKIIGTHVECETQIISNRTKKENRCRYCKKNGDTKHNWATAPDDYYYHEKCKLNYQKMLRAIKYPGT